MSAWQVVRDTRLHVLSTGSESTQITPAIVKFGMRYGQVLAWADKERSLSN